MKFPFGWYGLEETLRWKVIVDALVMDGQLAERADLPFEMVHGVLFLGGTMYLVI